MRPLTFHALSASATNGCLSVANQRFACQIGRLGQIARKREGDGATPIGNWSVLSVYYRADRVARPQTRLSVRIIGQNDGWCDDPLDRNYNRPVKHPYPASAENLWRDDHAYDLIVVLDHNISRRTINGGSAIFMHLTHDDKRPTAGCLAFAERDLRMILARLSRGQSIRISG